jgi:uncharacterized protein (TIGR03437 family)
MTAVVGIPANAQSAAAGAGAGLFQLVRTVQVAPDSAFGTGAFARVNYVPATDRLVVTFGTKPPSSATDRRAGYAYKEYDLEMNPTGKADYFVRCHASGGEANDSGSVMVGNDYYFAWAPDEVPGTSNFHGWKLTKYDAATWQTESEIYFPIENPQEVENDPMVAFVNEQLDVSSQFNTTGTHPPDYFTGSASYHYFFSPLLAAQGKAILDTPPHFCGSSMIFLNGVYHFVSSSSFLGEVDVMHYDASWRFLGKQMLRPYGQWSQGLAFDGDRFFVAYLDTTQRRDAPQFLPAAPNVHLAAFDLNWNLLDDVAVTNYSMSENTVGGRPWVILRNGRAYVSYDVDAMDPVTLEETLQWRAYVSVYDVAPSGAHCTYSASSPSIQAPVAGGSFPLTIATGIACPWTFSNLPDWVTVQGPASGADSATVTLNVAANPGPMRSARISVAGMAITVNQASNSLGVGAGGVVNAAAYSAPVAPGSIAAVFGNYLLPEAAAISSFPMPTSLGGLSLQFAGAPLAPLFYASFGQANVQVPWELAGLSQATVTAGYNGQNSPPQTVSLASYAPGIFTVNGAGTGRGAILDSSYTLVGDSKPAIAGAALQIYCTGLGPVTNQPATGAPAPSSPLAETTTRPTVTIGGAQAEVLFSGLTPGLVGLYQVNARVPAGAAKGTSVPVVVSIGGVQSNTVTIVVQ